MEKGFQEKSREAYKKCYECYDREIVEFVDEKTGKVHRFTFTHVKFEAPIKHVSLKSDKICYSIFKSQAVKVET